MKKMGQSHMQHNTSLDKPTLETSVVVGCGCTPAGAGIGRSVFRRLVTGEVFGENRHVVAFDLEHQGGGQANDASTHDVDTSLLRLFHVEVTRREKRKKLREKESGEDGKTRVFMYRENSGDASSNPSLHTFMRENSVISTEKKEHRPGTQTSSYYYFVMPVFPPLLTCIWHSHDGYDKEI